MYAKSCWCQAGCGQVHTACVNVSIFVYSGERERQRKERKRLRESGREEGEKGDKGKGKKLYNKRLPQIKMWLMLDNAKNMHTTRNRW